MVTDNWRWHFGWIRNPKDIISADRSRSSVPGDVTLGLYSAFSSGFVLCFLAEHTHIHLLPYIPPAMSWAFLTCLIHDEMKTLKPWRKLSLCTLLLGIRVTVTIKVLSCCALCLILTQLRSSEKKVSNKTVPRTDCPLQMLGEWVALMIIWRERIQSPWGYHSLEWLSMNLQVNQKALFFMIPVSSSCLISCPNFCQGHIVTPSPWCCLSYDDCGSNRMWEQVPKRVWFICESDSLPGITWFFST